MRKGLAQKKLRALAGFLRWTLNRLQIRVLGYNRKVLLWLAAVPALWLAGSVESPAQPPTGQPGQPPASLAPVLARVSEEAAVFQQNIVRAVSQETLEQRSWMPPSRFQPRVGQSAAVVPQPRLQTRLIVSEYSVGILNESESRDLVEFRQVVSVDGKAIRSQASARHALSLGLQSPDARVRKRMLEDFARNGLVDIATDYGLILLAFGKRGIADMQFAEEPERQAGAETVRSILWKQLTPEGGELQFHGRQFTRIPLAGRLLVRKADSLPIAIEVWAESVDSNKQKIRDEAVVAYQMSEHGFLTPVSVIHRHRVNGAILTENHYRYEPFKLFSADAEIQFDQLPETPPPPAPPADK